MITINQVYHNFGKKVLFNKINTVIGARDRIALIGSNGSGKTTLLRMLMNELEPEEGSIDKPDYVSVGYLPQDGISVSGKTLFKEAESAFGDVLELQKKVEQAEEEMVEMDTSEDAYYDLIDQIGEWEQQLEDHEPHKMKSRVEKILMGMGFKATDFDRDTGEFSGGWQMRIALAKLLLQNPSLIILDEPTNHLDIVSQNWVEQYLKHYQGSLIVISHDRAFLDEVTDRTLELKMGDLNSFKGNYTFYVKETEKRLEVLRKAYANQQKEIKEVKDWITRFRSNVKKASMVQSRIKALNKMELITIPRDEKKMFFRFPKAPPASAKVITITDLHKAYDDNVIFNGLNLRIDKGDRIAVVGVNGAGKSTLARIMAGTEPYQSGTVEKGLNTVLGYFAQSQAEELDPENTVLQEVEEAAIGNDDANPRGALGALLFSGDEALKKTSVLSGGEKNRVALAKMLMHPSNCMILDEPTNHLDIKSKEVLQEAINLFEGTVILVSHDRAFLDGVVNKVLEVSPGSTRMLTCNVSEYIERLEQETAEKLGK
ncbi:MULTISPECIES: ABC-F family ATP-binding cassette domain-containing protein [unclassified Lentimonas]|uniref:ABC-F family ATP-binding cassette domain-containing protein n=1 Tax=unclassified Lentimonas TaxID=2630993 RepID=UPI0013233347|nr:MULTISPECIES: ABC-F family ATP-binding cassette domain-containing protein [unclassified Lentimonas]CAA6680206.1 COG0488: ATPase components of ABC transporters with duplicated ATPase domains [Lentimonas sp. CC4]CAA6687040.1 COG0488: ATPase components of ABC transporters with duplicated ATPase domains [Lentimonas sp. CC6]CAA6695161.1 COG0488: ATPase components of ABC transporters with duplicated ATPase domains [Lentimonas sp. CC19]CAA6697254.1 COG0488: ATPase components of ABC transporters wit